MYDFVLHLPVRVLQVSTGPFSRFFFFYDVLIICEEHDTTRYWRSENIGCKPVTLFCFHFSILRMLWTVFVVFAVFEIYGVMVGRILRLHSCWWARSSSKVRTLNEDLWIFHLHACYCLYICRTWCNSVKKKKNSRAIDVYGRLTVA